MAAQRNYGCCCVLQSRGILTAVTVDSLDVTQAAAQLDRVRAWPAFL